MKKFIYTGLLAAVTLSLGSCSEENGGLLGNAKGGIALSVNLDSELRNGKLDSEISTSRASAARIEKEDLTLRVTSADGTYQETWGLGEFPADQQFSIGEYTVEAYYGKKGEEGFEKPYYHDHVTVSVLENEITPVNLTAAVNNSIIRVEYTDDFKKYYSNYSATVTTSEKSFLVSSKETRSVYVNPGTVSVTVNLTTPQGEELKVKTAPFTAKARFEHPVIFGTDQSVGKGSITITYDDSLDMVDEVINLDDLTAASEPTITPEGFTTEEAVEVVEGSLPENRLKMNLIGSGGISSVTLNTSSPSLRMQGWPSKVELVNADIETQTLLTSLGLDVRGLFKKVDRMAVIDFTNLCNQLSYTEGGKNESVFTVTLTDRFDRQTEPVTLTIKTVKALYEFDEFEPLYYYSPDVAFTFKYNGTELEKNVKFYYLNDRGTWTEAPYQSVNHVSENTYKILIQVPPHEHDLTLKGEYGDKQIPEVTVPRIGNVLMADECNVFATSALVNILPNTRAYVGGAKIFAVESDGSFTPMNATEESNGYRLTGLTPATSYKLIAEVDGKRSKSTVIQTEAAQQLPTEQFKDWQIAGSGRNWTNWRIGDGSVWGTNNPLTTSQGDDYAKNRAPGTLDTPDAHSNGTAILLRTIGWGSSNQAYADAQAIGSMKYADVGLLHLGSSRSIRPSKYSDISGPTNTEDLNCGLTFSSRPAALKFWTKYNAKNDNDRGYVCVEVRDDENNIIARNDIEIDKVKYENYTEVTLSLSYPENAPKAAKIYVCFQSTNKTNALERDRNWISCPGFTNVNGLFLGSQLYIDDIELTY